jgi:lysozyme
MGLSAIGSAVLMAREGRVLKAYKDTQGVWTIGAGVTTASGLITVTPGLVLTAAQCDALNAKAFALYAGYVDKALLGTIPEQHTYDALVSFCYNVGPGAFRKSTCLKRIKAGDLKGAKAAMLLWNKPAIIISRRQAEADQLVTPYDVRMPSRVLGVAPIKSTGAPPITGPVVPVIPIPALPTRQPDLTLPAWLRALFAFVEAVLAAQPAKRAF